MKAFIHQPGMYDIELKKGHTFRYDIWFGGEPPPIVTWEKNGMVIAPEERISMELFAKKTVYCERNTVLTVKKADRAKDTGTYKIRLSCEGGSFEATGYVNVLDVPGKPRMVKADEVRLSPPAFIYFHNCLGPSRACEAELGCPRRRWRNPYPQISSEDDGSGLQ